MQFEIELHHFTVVLEEFLILFPGEILFLRMLNSSVEESADGIIGFWSNNFWLDISAAAVSTFGPYPHVLK